MSYIESRQFHMFLKTQIYCTYSKYFLRTADNYFPEISISTAFEFKNNNLFVQISQRSSIYYLNAGRRCDNYEVQSLFDDMFQKSTVWHDWFQAQTQYINSLSMFEKLTFLQYIAFGDNLVNDTAPVGEVFESWSLSKHQKVPETSYDNGDVTSHFFEGIVDEKTFNRPKESIAAHVLEKRSAEYHFRFPLLAQFMEMNHLDVRDTNLRAKVNKQIREAILGKNKELLDLLQQQTHLLIEHFKGDFNHIIMNAPLCNETLHVFRGLKHKPKRHFSQEKFKSTTYDFGVTENYGYFLLCISVLPGTPFCLSPVSNFAGNIGEIVLPPSSHISQGDFDVNVVKFYRIDVDKVDFGVAHYVQ